ncbi:orotate phosphoribosyltransferase [Lutibacter profundi]|uniref:Orotate phosphoribosyltransferase n=1 Tax=Lutibacter profundi TaxID=1622118 RepID=A0A0X8G5T4_9FLAO|nr:orotate phosphoribosyltransferase [Lutibacter profundi]AMC10575.1 orotate phosphoribosyltransferase [Lutibacter profundi]
MNLESKKSTINKSQKEFFEFLSNLENFRQLMPENIEKFEVDGESFIFSLKGMPEIRLVVKEKQEFDKIILGAASSKLNFTLTALINKISDSSCESQLLFEGDFNPMMAMMVKKPLQKFIDTLSEKATNL